MNKKQRLDYLQEQLLEASYLVFDGFINDYDDYEEYSRVDNLFFDTIYYDWRWKIEGNNLIKGLVTKPSPCH
jgi:hypothetical protein